MQNFQHQFIKDAPATNGAEVVLWQSSDGTTGPGLNDQYPGYTEFDVAFKLSEDVTVVHKWGPTLQTADADMVIVNGSSYTGDVATASTPFFKTYQLRPGRNRISIVAGATPPTAAKIACSNYSGPRVV